MRFSGTAKKDIDRWVGKGLIDRPTANRLQAELLTQSNGFGLGGVLAVLGALLLGAAVLTLVAANWESFPRLGRVLFILLLIWASYLVGAWRDKRGDTIFSQVAYLLGAITFGGGIALIGQMYHLSGDAASAALVWAVGTLVGAVLLRSFALTALTGGIGLWYLFAAVSDASWHNEGYIWVTPALALLVAGVSRWNGSRFGIHAALWLILGTLICYRFNYISLFNTRAVPLDYMFAFGGAAVFFGVAFAEDVVDQVTAFARPLIGYALAMSFFGFCLLQIGYEGATGSVAILGLAVIALSIGALLVKGRDHGGVRALAYTAFAAEVLYLASVTIGSLIGTSAFFLFIGIVVLFIAFLVIRIEKRINAVPEATS
jgi:uncharacterized membrane protein